MLPGIIITAALLLSNVAFVWILAATALISAKWLIAISVGLAAITAGVFFLTRKSERIALTIIGAVLTLIFIIGEILGAFFIAHGASALQGITTPETEFAEIGIYVRTEDSAQTLEEVKDYPFGILAQLDRENTNSALNVITENLGKSPALTEYEGISDLVYALIANKTVDVIVLNTAFLELLEDTDGYEEDVKALRLLDTLQVETEGEEVKPSVPAKMDSFVLYITGIDTRSKKISKKSRSDVNILAAVNVDTGNIVLISTPRDYYVPLSISKGIPDKLTHSGVYGTQVSIDTMEMIYDVEIDYYFKLNFEGFKNIIDALGGITVRSDYDFTVSDTHFVKGLNEVDGRQALFFARDRKKVGSDRQRGKHQMEVVKGVINKATSPALLANFSEIMKSLEGSFETSVPYETVAKLVRNQLDRGTKWNMVSYAVNGTGAKKKVYSLSQKAYVMIPDQSTIEEANHLIKQVLDGEKPTLAP